MELLETLGNKCERCGHDPAAHEDSGRCLFEPNAVWHNQFVDWTYHLNQREFRTALKHELSLNIQSVLVEHGYQSNDVQGGLRDPKVVQVMKEIRDRFTRGWRSLAKSHAASTD
jgi:predicted amidophosphoribosyltransferase